MLEQVLNRIASLRDYAVDLLMEIIKRPAVNPAFGGKGEYEKAMLILSVIDKWGFDDIMVINVPDSRVESGVRPNIIGIIKGEVKDKLWILTHLDVVPPGDLSAWTVTRPFEPVLRDGKVYGRGSEDNGQSIVASLIATKSLLEEGIRPKRTIALAFVSDEEAGSRYGLEYLVKHYSDLFSLNDVALVPDAGSNKGDFIEIAEKSIIWIKLRFKGIQVHASIPYKGLNPHRLASEYIILLDRLVKEKYGKVDRLFDPPITTCEPTMVRNSSGSPNIIPGEHEIVLDCRVLPEYSLDELIKDMYGLFSALKIAYEKNFEGVTYPILEHEVIERSDAAPPTPVNSPFVRLFVEALRKLRNIEPRIGGIGGGTVAAFFRKIGIPAVVWSTIDEVAHMPNEYCVIDNLLADAKVMAYLMLNA